MREYHLPIGAPPSDRDLEPLGTFRQRCRYDYLNLSPFELRIVHEHGLERTASLSDHLRADLAECEAATRAMEFIDPFFATLAATRADVCRELLKMGATAGGDDAQG